MRAEDVHGAGGHPVEEGRLVEEADAVDVGGDVVVALHHLAGDLDVDGVDVVEQAGGEEAADLEDEPGEDKDCERAWAPAANYGFANFGFAISFQIFGSQSFSFVFLWGGRCIGICRSLL